ncbi:MAG: type II secretion system protein GspJ, partial [Myxococcota bacterium]
APREQRRRANARSGFTLFEVLGVVLVTALLLGAAISFFLNLTRQAARATESTREVRRAAALVDRIAADLEHTLLVKKPADADPLSRPWLFVAESRYALPGAQRGSDQLKFIRRDLPRSSDGPASDLAMVAYTLERSEDDSNFELRRWSTPELPESLDREFPRSDDPDSLLVADDLSYFALRFLDETGEWKDRWDSTQLVDSSELPIAVEIEVALAASAESPSDADPELDVEPIHYARAVELPLRPIDLAALLDPEDEQGAAAEDEEGDAEGRTLADCVDPGKLSGQVGGLSESDLAALNAALQNTPAAAFAPYAAALAGHPAVNPDCL